MRLAGLTSGRGRVLRHLAQTRPGDVTVSVILTTDPDAPILDTATAAEVPTEVIDPSPGATVAEHERRVATALDAYDTDLVCLDGYDGPLSDDFLDHVPKTIRVHRSLLPSFPGSTPVQAALAAGVDVTGCTVHIGVDPAEARILTQEPVPVAPGDTTDTLTDRLVETGALGAAARAVRLITAGETRFDATAESQPQSEPAQFPHRRLTSTTKRTGLRYGENPHQAAAVYEDLTTTEAAVVQATQHNDGAKAMGYNNYNDADAALNLVKEFDAPAAAVIKHTNPAGVAVADTIAQAYHDALATDPKSAFGGIVALNRPCDVATAEQIVSSFKEVVVAPGYTEDALAVLCAEDNLRVLEVSDQLTMTTATTTKPLVGGQLVQDRNRHQITPADLEVVTDREPDPERLETMCFAWQTVKHVKSNAVVFAHGTETVGIGAGQVSRVDAVEIATMKANADADGKDATGAVMASDAFFPFPDGIEAAAGAGIEAVVQPGGSVNDDEVIAAANDHDIAMAFTGVRAFRHD